MTCIKLSEYRTDSQTLLLFDNIIRYIEDVLICDIDIKYFRVVKCGITTRTMNTTLTYNIDLGSIDKLYIVLKVRELYKSEYIIELEGDINEDFTKLQDLIQSNVITEFDKGYLPPMRQIKNSVIPNNMQDIPFNILTNKCDLYKLTKGKKLIFKDSGEEIPFNRLSITYNKDEDKWYYTLVVNDQFLEINLTDEEGEIILC